MSFDLNTKSLLDENYCVMLIQNSSTIFVFWKFSDYKNYQFEKGFYKKDITIKLLDENNNCVVDIPVEWNKARLYVALPRSLNSVRVEIYAENSNSREKLSSYGPLKISYMKETKKDYIKIK